MERIKMVETGFRTERYNEEVEYIVTSDGEKFRLYEEDKAVKHQAKLDKAEEVKKFLNVVNVDLHLPEIDEEDAIYKRSACFLFTIPETMELSDVPALLKTFCMDVPDNFYPYSKGDTLLFIQYDFSDDTGDHFWSDVRTQVMSIPHYMEIVDEHIRKWNDMKKKALSYVTPPTNKFNDYATSVH